MNIHKERIKDLQVLLKENKLDAIIITSPREIFFFSGFHQDRTLLLITQKEAISFLPKMFLEQFRQDIDFIDTFIYDNLHYDVVCEIRKRKLKKVVFDPISESYIEGKYWVSQGLKEYSGLVYSLRMIKKGEEIDNLRKAGKIASATFDIIKPKIKKGVSEKQIAVEMEYIMMKMGASGKSFELIVAFGENSALPHHETSDRKLKNNEVVLLDYGCVYNRYCSDITRTFFYGRPSPEFNKVYDIVNKAQKMGVLKAKEGIKALDVDRTCRDYISDNGYGQYFIHGTGHGVGLEIHEEPYVNTKGEKILKSGMAVTVEPGIYLYGKFGIRIEDTILIGKNSSEVLTK